MGQTFATMTSALGLAFKCPSAIPSTTRSLRAAVKLVPIVRIRAPKKSNCTKFSEGGGETDPALNPGTTAISAALSPVISATRTFGFVTPDEKRLSLNPPIDFRMIVSLVGSKWL